jgi:hypothetical protein
LLILACPNFSISLQQIIITCNPALVPNNLFPFQNIKQLW